MSRIGSIARLPAGRRATWVAVAFWLIVVALAGPLARRPQARALATEPRSVRADDAEARVTL